MDVSVVKIDQISPDEKFRYGEDRENPVLEDSVETEGILIPIWLCRLDELVIVDGFERFRISRKNGFKEIPVVIFPKNNLEIVFLRGLHLNFVNRKMSSVEKLNAYFLALENFSLGTARAVADLLQLRHVPKIEEIIQKVHNFPRPFRRYFHQQNLSLRMLGKLADYNFVNYRQWFELAKLLNFNQSEIAVLLEEVRDICLREAVPPATLFGHMSLNEIAGGKLTPQQKIRRIKKQVHERRFPVLTKINLNLQHAAKNLQKRFNGDATILWDKTLENPGVTLNIKFSDDQKVDRFLQILAEPAVRSQLHKLLAINKNLPEEKK